MYEINNLRTYSKELLYLESEDYLFLSGIFIEWRKQKEIKLNNARLEILKYFMHNYTNSSANQCHKYLTSNKKCELAKNNLRNNIKYLYKIGLLKEKKILKDGDIQEANKHNATYYELSAFGIFYILKQGILNNPFDCNVDIILKYPNFKLYNCILYKFINLETLKRIGHRYILSKILNYLNRICIMIEYIFTVIINQFVLLESIEKIGGIMLNSSFLFGYLIQGKFQDINNIF